MLKEMLSRLEPVHVATTREEREAVYRFRYEVYYEEFGRELGSPDHERRWVTDSDDEKDYTTILYTGSPDAITGTLRLRCWEAGQVPHHDVEELSMDLFPGLEDLSVAEMGRLMIRPSARGKLQVAALIRKAYEIYACEKKTDLAFCYCSTGLVPYYLRFGLRPYGGRPIHAPDGIMLPLVTVISDWKHQRAARSFLAPLARRCFAAGERRIVDIAPFQHLFDSNALQVDGECVWHEVESALGANRRARSVLDALPASEQRRLVRRGIVTDVPRGMLMTRQGFHEREIFVVLDGEFRAESDGRILGRVGRGELFGEDAFLDPKGRRAASVEALSDGRVLVLRGKTLASLMRREPDLAAPLQARLETLFSSRQEALSAATAAA
jgi:hypothetical protein